MSEEPEKKEEKRKAADLLRDRGELLLADQMRLMADNQATLDQCNKHDQKIRDLDMRVAEAVAKGKYESMEDESEEKEGKKDMKILLHSPTTNVYQFPKEEKEEGKKEDSFFKAVNKVDTIMEEIKEEEKKSRIPDILKKAAVMAALVGSGAGAVAIPWAIKALNKPDRPVESPVTFEDTRMDVEIEKFVPEREGGIE